MNSHTASDDDPVTMTVSDDVATITLNRPDVLNAVVPALADGLCTAIEDASRMRVGAAIMQGAGRAFCAGHDLRHNVVPDDASELRAEIERLQDVTRAVRRAPFPVIAKVHGYALGAGCEFALTCDLVVADEAARFGFPEVGVGLSVTGGISRLLPATVGPVVAKELVLLGEHFSAHRARELGLVNLVVPASDLDAAATRWAKTLASRPRMALQLAKSVLDAGVGDLAGPFEAEIGHAIATQNSDAAREASDRFGRGERTGQ